MRTFFDKTIEHRCEYCTEGWLSADGKNVLCKKKGVVAPGYFCSGFRYDPLLRVPRVPAPLPETYRPEDFLL
ncbi:MAG TPA: hypothetical protein PLP20_00505 [Oscillospiraceae bacterium]|nr:hypothetical protein [Oscillospiraceae bacterium]HPV99523.1 hypothetical protein [Oscillospiraceae bacterium]